MVLTRLLGCRPLFWPTAFSLPGILVLLALGFWQLDRLERKQALLAEIKARVEAPAQEVPAIIPDPEALKFRHMSARGVFHHDAEMHLMAHTEAGKLGYQIITPLERADGTYLLVNRGWVPQDRRDPATRAEGQVTGEVEVSGLVRTAWTQGFFVPDNAPQANFWFWGDIDGMARAAHLDHWAPVFLEADATPNPGGLPLGGQTRLTFPNDHLQYAITWFALAVALAVIWVAYHRAHARKAQGDLR